VRIISIKGFSGGRWLIRYAFPARCGCYDIRMTTQLKQDYKPTENEALQAAINHQNEIKN